jgi:hypothetical protein
MGNGDRGMKANRSRVFLCAFEVTGNITLAASAAGITRGMHYRRLKKDPVYKAAFDVSQEIAIGVLEDEATRRAVEGIEELVLFQGRVCYAPVIDDEGLIVLNEEGKPIISRRPLKKRTYSDSMLQFLLRGARPEKYRERFEHTGKDGGPINAHLEVFFVTPP